METIHPVQADSESVLLRLYHSISKEAKLAFYSAFFCGLLVHIYMFTNKFPNHDDLAGMFSCFDQAFAGRWMIKYLMPFNTNISLPWVNGVFAILMIALSSALIVSMFRLKRPLYIVLTSMVMACSPVLASFFAYMFLADVNLFGAMLAVLGAYLAEKKRFGFVFSAVFFACSMAIYQTFLFFALALMAVQLIIRLLDRDSTDRDVLDLLWRFAAAVVLGAVVYLGVTKIYLNLGDIGLTYLNTGEVLSPNFAEIPHRIFQCYYFFVEYSNWYNPFFNSRWIQYVFILMIFAFYLLVFLLAMRGAKRAWRIVLAVILSLAMPILWDSGFLAGNPHILMQYAMTCFFIGIIVLFHRYADIVRDERKNWYRFLYILGSWFVVFSMFSVCYSWTLYNNQAYFQLQRQYTASYALAERVVDRVEQIPEYTLETPVLVAGTFSYANYPAAAPESQYGMSGTVGLGYDNEFYYMSGPNGRFKLFVRAYLGVSWPDPDEAALRDLIEKYDDFASMPCFPAAGSVQYLDGIIVVKGS